MTDSKKQIVDKLSKWPGSMDSGLIFMFYIGNLFVHLLSMSDVLKLAEAKGSISYSCH